MFSSYFCLALQVNRKVSVYCSHSDDWFLLLLPCPLCIKCIPTHIALLPTNLLLSDDIETNAGPSEKELLSEPLDIQKKVQGTSEEIIIAHNEIKEQISTLDNRIDRTEQQLSNLGSLTKQVK